MVKFFNFLNMATNSDKYVGLVFLSLHFVSRERFFYYLTVTWLQSFMITFLKFSFLHPRPVWVFDGLLDVGCSSSFGNPSGHSLESANMMLFVILDHFFASKWSRDNLPHLNTKSTYKDPKKFSVSALCALSFWLLIVFDRIYLGKHTFN